MSNILANDLRAQYEKLITNIRRIVEAFPENRWLEPHGDEWYIPCRIAYHLAVNIDNQLSGGFKDPDFASKLPYGAVKDATAETLPSKTDFFAYFEAVVGRAQGVLAVIDDDSLAAPIEQQREWMGASQVGLHLYMMRELSAHTGELNKMLVENGLDDIWVAR